MPADSSSFYSAQPRLVNPVHLDPALWIPLPQSSEAWLCDCGDLHALGLGELQRVSTVFLSHGHIDHWIGLDQLLRAQLFCDATLRVLGPVGTLAMLAGRLSGYSWNLTSGSPFAAEGYELQTQGWVGQHFPCSTGFRPREAARPAFPDLRGWQMAWVELEHGVPCLGYRLEAPASFRFLPDKARELGLMPGPWVEDLKRSRIDADRGRLIEGRPAGSLWSLLQPLPTAQIAYITDTRLSPSVRRRIGGAFGNTATLWCEAAFLESQRALAESKLHATAAEAASLAQELRATSLHLFHLSRRTSGAVAEHLAEARQIFPAASAGTDGGR